MTGPEHYREAEQLLDRAANAEGMGHAGEIIDRAQVHATLALVAISADTAPPARGEGEWQEVLS